MTEATMPNESLHPGKTVLISFFFTAFIAVAYGFGIYLFSVVVSDMKADIGFDYMAVGMITGGAQIAFFLAALLSGIVSPRLGAGRMILGSVVICGVSLICLGVVRNIWFIAAILSILGGCAASVWVPMVEVVGRFIPFKHRSKVLGLMSSGTSYGVFINGLIVPYFITHHHWSDIWLAVGAGTVMITVLSIFFLAKSGVLGSFSSDSSEHEGNSSLSAGFTKNYITPTNIVIWLMLFFNGLSCSPFQTYLAPYIRDELMFPVKTAGEIWSVIGFVGMGGGFAMGALSDKTGIRFTLTLTYLFLAIAAVLISVHAAHYQLVVAGILFGLSFYAIFGLVPAYIAKTSVPTQSTVIFGIANVTLGVGSMLGNFLGGWSKAAFGTFLWIYVAIFTVAIASIMVTWLLPDERQMMNSEAFL